MSDRALELLGRFVRLLATLAAILAAGYLLWWLLG
jgi:hypothetical protein